MESTYTRKLRLDRLILDEQINAIQLSLRQCEVSKDSVSQKVSAKLRESLAVLRRAKLDNQLGIPISSSSAAKTQPARPVAFFSGGRQGRERRYETRG